MFQILLIAIEGSPVENTYVNLFFWIQLLSLPLVTFDDYFFTIGCLLELSGLLF